MSAAVEGERMADLDQLEAAARERWGERWTIEVRHFADGSTSAHAFRSRGRTDAGHLEKERLFIGDDGEIRADRVVEARETVEYDDLGRVGGK